jgi:hypothetical protein
VLLAMSATTIVIVVLLGEILYPRVAEELERRKARRARVPGIADHDPGRERRAEQKARDLLRSCVNDEEWACYRDLGFIRVWGVRPAGPGDGRRVDAMTTGGAPYAYLIYPHKPIIAYLPQTGRLLNEYCVEFPDEEKPYGSALLPDSDDMLAKWMALTGDERGLIASANMHLPGRQIDPKRVKRDLWRLREWERERARQSALRSRGSAGSDEAGGAAPGGAATVPGP